MMQDIQKDAGVRERILEAAIEHFSRYGYAGANLQQIAKEAGVTRGPLYYYFQNKAELYTAAVEHVLNEQRASYDEILSADRPILEIIREQYQYCMLDKGLFNRIGSGGKDEPVVKGTSEFLSWLFDKKLEAFQRAKKRGELRPDCDTRELATFMYIYFYGVVTLNSVEDKNIGYDHALLDNSVELFLELVKQRYMPI